jgi:predicted DNA-binding transcriptional regulator AlpA
MNTSKHPRIGNRAANHMLTVDEILEDLGDVSRRTFYEWRAKGTGPKCLKLPNGELRVRRAEYERWLSEREAAL